jgi:Ca-activated chloride channel family protein
MNFAAPQRLWLLVVAAGLVAAYIVVQQRRRRDAARFASPELLPLLVPRRTGWWRHAVAVVFGAGLLLATIGAAQPTVPDQAERKQATIMVAVDTSDSMKATDVAPDRLTAAVTAAKAFVGDLPSTFAVGLVTADAAPALLVSPTTDHQAVQSALNHLTTSPGTALGEAIYTALAAIPKRSVAATQGQNKAPAALIVLLSDGKSTTGRPDGDAIAAAVDAGVPVSAIAFGTDHASVESAGQTVDVPVDRSALEAIAKGTNGQFFQAATPAELRQVYQNINADITVIPADRDIAGLFAAGALLLLLVASLVSMLGTGRVVWT